MFIDHENPRLLLNVPEKLTFICTRHRMIADKCEPIDRHAQKSEVLDQSAGMLDGSI